MADNVAITAGAGTNVAADELTDGVLGSVKVQFMKIMDGTLDSSTKAAVSARGLAVDSNQQGTAATGSWTSVTALDSAVTLATAGYGAALIAVRAGTTMTGGGLIFEQDDGAGNWYPLYAYQIDSSTPSPRNTLTFAASTNYLFAVNVAGVANVRVRLNPVITGTGTVTLRLVPIQTKEILTPVVVQSPTGSAISVAVSASSAGTIGHTEDSATADGDGGVGMLMKRSDAPGSTAATTTDGDYTVPITDSSGRARVTVMGETQAQVSQALSVAGAGSSSNSTTNAVADVSRMGNCTVTMSGTWTVTAGSPPTLVFECSDDGGTTWFPIAGARTDTGIGERTVYAAAGTVRAWDFPCNGISLLRVRLSANNPASGSISIRISAAGMLGEPIPSVLIARGTLPTYRAVGRQAAVNIANALAFTHVANTDKMLMVIQHPNTSTKLVKIRRIEVQLASNSLAGNLSIDARRTNAAGATGNPAITPEKINPADAAADATCLALPTTPAADAAAAVSVGMVELNTAAGGTAMAPQTSVLYDASQQDPETPPLILRPYTAEGIGIWIRSTVASVNRYVPMIIFTEE